MKLKNIKIYFITDILTPNTDIINSIVIWNKKFMLNYILKEFYFLKMSEIFILDFYKLNFS